MSESKTKPQFSEKGLTEAELRRQRQAEALRANLARRKAQVRSRADDQDDAPTEAQAQGGSAARD